PTSSLASRVQSQPSKLVIPLPTGALPPDPRPSLGDGGRHGQGHLLARQAEPYRRTPGTSRARSAGPSIKLLSVALDCPDAGQLAAFYARVTGGKVIFRDNRWAVVQAPGAPRLTPWLTPQCPHRGRGNGGQRGEVRGNVYR